MTFKQAYSLCRVTPDSIVYYNGAESFTHSHLVTGGKMPTNTVGDDWDCRLNGVLLLCFIRSRLGN